MAGKPAARKGQTKTSKFRWNGRLWPDGGNNGGNNLQISRTLAGAGGPMSGGILGRVAMAIDQACRQFSDWRHVVL